MTVNLSSRFRNSIKSLDEFGNSIKIKYKGRDTFQTLVGGITTIIVKLFIVAYFLSNCTNVFMRQYSTINQSVIKKSIYNDEFMI